jgi:hypothetical protein
MKPNKIQKIKKKLLFNQIIIKNRLKMLIYLNKNMNDISQFYIHPLQKKILIKLQMIKKIYKNNMIILLNNSKYTIFKKKIKISKNLIINHFNKLKTYITNPNKIYKLIDMQMIVSI